MDSMNVKTSVLATFDSVFDVDLSCIASCLTYDSYKSYIRPEFLKCSINEIKNHIVTSEYSSINPFKIVFKEEYFKQAESLNKIFNKDSVLKYRYCAPTDIIRLIDLTGVTDFVDADVLIYDKEQYPFAKKCKLKTITTRSVLDSYGSYIVRSYKDFDLLPLLEGKNIYISRLRCNYKDDDFKEFVEPIRQIALHNFIKTIDPYSGISVPNK